MYLAIDQGTTGTRSALFDSSGALVDSAYRELRQIYPKPGWVEHDPEEIWESVVATISLLLNRNRAKIEAIGITNQRETVLLWDRSGKPLHNAIVWQCRRTSLLCDSLRNYEQEIRTKTGLPLDPYFSGTKIRWLLDHVQREDVLVGTIDAWLIWKLTRGKVHATDHTNASRTMLFNIRTMEWDEHLCELLGVPMGILPEVRRSIGDFGVVSAIPELAGVPIRAAAGDQQAALFAHRDRAKCTYGTGAFLLMRTSEPVDSRDLITTLAVDADGSPCYAIEGSVFIAGAVVQWCRDELGILDHAGDSEALARSVPDNGGTYLVPAFCGLRAPYWDPEARGTLVGITRGTTRAHIVRAALESIAFQVADVFQIMEKESGLSQKDMAVDGGAAANNLLCQFQADILQKRIIRSGMLEATSLGAARMAGAGSSGGAVDAFVPTMSAQERHENLAGWKRAVRQARTR